MYTIIKIKKSKEKSRILNNFIQNCFIIKNSVKDNFRHIWITINNLPLEKYKNLFEITSFFNYL